MFCLLFGILVKMAFSPIAFSLLHWTQRHQKLSESKFQQGVDSSIFIPDYRTIINSISITKTMALFRRPAYVIWTLWTLKLKMDIVLTHRCVPTWLKVSSEATNLGQRSMPRTRAQEEYETKREPGNERNWRHWDTKDIMYLLVRQVIYQCYPAGTQHCFNVHLTFITSIWR